MTKKKAPVRKRRVQTQALVRAAAAPPAAEDPSTPLGIIERIVKDKGVDVEKLARVIELQKDLMKVQAKVEFDKAFVAMQPELPTISKRGKILNKDKTLRSRYARLGEDIQPVIKPILQRFGFGIRHVTEWPKTGVVRVVGILKHQAGHEETSAFEAPADESDYRTHVQSLGSTVQYGRRYTTVDLLNLTVQGIDDDGQSGPPSRQAPRQDTRRPGTASTPPDIDVPYSGRQDAKVITEGQVKRLWVIVRNSGRTDEEIKLWLKRKYRVDSSKDVRQGDYDRICEAIEAEGDLPE